MQTAFALAPEMELQYPASKVANRFQLVGPDGLLDYRFLSQLWALFGTPPATTYEGFVYQIIHLETGIVFQAYSGASGPAYCFSDIHKEKANAIMTSLEELLKDIALIDCEIIIETDFGKYRIGLRDGKPIEGKVG